MKKLILAFVALLISVSIFGASVTLNWTDNSNNETGFRIERSIGGGSFVHLVDVAANTTAFKDEVNVGGTYGYRVRAFNNNSESAFTPTATVTVPPSAGSAPSAPSNLNLTLSGRLTNISSRGLVSVGAEIVIGGFTVTDGPANVLIRAVGPTLGGAPFNVPGVLADPQIQLVGGASNDNWSGATIAAAAANVGAFALPVGSKDAALLVTLPPGGYTVHVSGVGNSTGVALLEIYLVP